MSAKGKKKRASKTLQRRARRDKRHGEKGQKTSGGGSKEAGEPEDGSDQACTWPLVRGAAVCRPLHAGAALEPFLASTTPGSNRVATPTHKPPPRTCPSVAQPCGVCRSAPPCAPGPPARPEPRTCMVGAWTAMMAVARAPEACAGVRRAALKQEGPGGR